MIRTDAEPDPDDLDAGYSQLAAEFNSDTANGERRAARDRYTGRPEQAQKAKNPGRPPGSNTGFF